MNSICDGNIDGITLDIVVSQLLASVSYSVTLNVEPSLHAEELTSGLALNSKISGGMTLNLVESEPFKRYAILMLSNIVNYLII